MLSNDLKYQEAVNAMVTCVQLFPKFDEIQTENEVCIPTSVVAN
jgi:hypothetical protein